MFSGLGGVAVVADDVARRGVNAEWLYEILSPHAEEVLDVVYSSSLIALQPPTAERDSERVIAFQLSPDEAPFARGLAEEIEAAFPDHLPMLSEAGRVILPDIDDLHELGKSRSLAGPTSTT